MSESRTELKAGAVFLAAIAAFIALLALLGELSFSSTSSVRVDFAHTGNVVVGAPVKLGGVAVGRVANIALRPDRVDARGLPMPIEMTLRFDALPLSTFRRDASVTVATVGPLGEPYLEIAPGSAEQRLGDATSIRGTDAPRLDLVQNELAALLEVVTSSVANNPAQLSKMLEGVASVSHALGGVLETNQGELTQTVKEMALAAQELRAVLSLARAQLEPNGKATRLLDDASSTARMLRSDWPELSKKASTSLTGLAAVSGALTAEDGARLKSTLQAYQHAGEKLEALSTRADALLRRIEAGEGTAGALVKDKQVYDDLKSLLADLRKHPWKMLWKD
jgi:phospholipid/cholesterol/gamma-HCH transport system substrate-binding protein